jgi:hypothetical protein
MGLKASDVPELSGGIDTATATSGAATITSQTGTITTEALTTAAAADYTLTLTNTRVDAGCVPFFSVANGTNSAGGPCLAHSPVVTEDQIVVKVRNFHASAALNGTLKINFLLI